MDDKQKVYIKGSSNRGAEVIKTLEDLGGNNLYNYDGEDDAADYYINPNGVICLAYTKGNAAYPFLMEFYKEIKLPKKTSLKDGTLLVKSIGDKKEYFVYSENDSVINGVLTSYINVDDNGYEAKLTSSNCIGYKVATKDDIKCFQELLHHYGKDWSFKYKILSDWKFEPKHDEEYWYITEVGEICHTFYNPCIYDLKRVRVGNCFRSKDDAFNMMDKIAKIMHPGKPTI